MSCFDLCAFCHESLKASDERYTYRRHDMNQNVSTLLGELDIPRAISAPPHLDDRWATHLVRFVLHITDVFQSTISAPVPGCSASISFFCSTCSVFSRE